MADSLPNVGAVEIELADGSLRKIYVPGLRQSDQIEYANSLYNIPGLFL